MFDRENPKLVALKACLNAVDHMLIDYRVATQELTKAVAEAPKNGLTGYSIEALTYKIHTAADNLDALGSTLGRFATSYADSLPQS